MSSIRNTATTQPCALVAQALAIYRSIAACHAHIANNNSRSRSNTHALTAALMLPCYQAEFRNLVLALTSDEERELRYALDEFRNSAA
ncbi:hypothetical protein [Variovorax sp. R-27]|uniref:hypothetical protein n=1 Tax=Variovorax sp. R-27 TaxID=3404058 RepID=UPI003CF7D849